MVRIKIKKMPSKRMLEKYLEGNYINNQVFVLFDKEKGEFRYTEEYVRSLSFNSSKK